MYSIAGTIDFQKWNIYSQAGDRGNLVAGRTYHVLVTFLGSQVTLTVDGVNVLSSTLPRPMTPSQVGLMFMDEGDIRATNYAVQSADPSVFVVMEFGSPYDDVYSEVIERVCRNYGLKVIRADEIYGPGLIIADITRDGGIHLTGLSTMCCGVPIKWRR